MNKSIITPSKKFLRKDFEPIGCKDYPNIDVMDCVGTNVTRKREYSVYNRRTERIEHIMR